MKAATKTIEIQGIEINIPVGSMDRPSEWSEVALKTIQDSNNWKLPTARFLTRDESKANELAYCLDWYHGGHEITEEVIDGKTWYTVQSLGYYHYVGA